MPSDIDALARAFEASGPITRRPDDESPPPWESEGTVPFYVTSAPGLLDRDISCTISHFTSHKGKKPRSASER